MNNGIRIIVAVAPISGLLMNLAPASAAGPAAAFQGIGTLPSPHPDSYPLGISADGTVVVGAVRNADDIYEAMRWSQGSGIQQMGLLSGPSCCDASQAVAASDDGSVIVGYSTTLDGPTEAFRWTSATGMVGLGHLPSAMGFPSAALAASSDGSIIAGMAYAQNPDGGFHEHAMRWGGTMSDLGLLPGHDASTMPGISGDGSILAGWSVHIDTGESQAVIWTQPTGLMGLGLLPGGTFSAAGPISRDGLVIVGLADDSNGLTRPFRWTLAGGMSALTIVPGWSGFTVTAVSGDGSRIIGRAFDGTRIFPYIWDQASGMQNLTDLLVANGANVTGWSLTDATGISADGSTIVGYGVNPQGEGEGWVAHFIPDADSDGDGLLDDWEINGIPYTDVFGAEQRLPLVGANPLRKDIYVEVDAMTGLAPSQAALDRVKAAFDATGLGPNPIVPAPAGVANGLPGITLHADLDESNIPAAVWTLDDTDGDGKLDWPTEFDAIKLTATSGTTLAGYFGTTIERNDPDAAAIRAAKAKAYRYCVFGQQFDAAGTSGLAELPGNDFMVMLGLWSNGSGGGGGTTSNQAGTFMHELGHTLGLGHGGRAPGGPADDINFKPNYFSVMSYNWQNPHGWQSPGSWPLDAGRFGYSTFALPLISEAAADDCLPAMVVPVSALAGVRYPHNTHNDGGIPPVVVYGRYDVASDWNNDDVDQCGPIALPVDLTRVRPTSPTFGRSPGQSLNGRDDWSVLVYRFLDLPSFGAGVHGDALGASGGELDVAEDAGIEAMLPPFCTGDIVNDRSVNIDDLLAVINAWGACPQGCLADIAPVLQVDGQVNIDDLLAVIDGWGACP